MNDDSSSQPRSWFERLSLFLQGEPKDRDDLIGVLRSAQQNKLIKADALAMLEGVLQVSEMQVRDIMIPRAQMTVIEESMNLSQMLPVIIDSAHSRFPVIGDNRDDIEGVLLAKDLLRYSFLSGGESNESRFNLKDILRPAVIVPESKRLDVLLKEFRSSRNHMAIVVDEYGGVAGLVTIEDVLEQIVGEIEDEFDFDEEDDNIKQHSAREFIIKARTPIEDFNEYFQTQLSDDEFDTIGGLIMQAFGHMPARGEKVTINDFRFKVVHADNRRIRLLRATRLEEDAAEQAAPNP